jgi:hypothetical protein
MDKNVKLRDITHESTWNRVVNTMTRWDDPRVLRMVQKELSYLGAAERIHSPFEIPVNLLGAMIVQPHFPPP